MGIYIHKHQTSSTVPSMEESSAQIKQLESEKYFELFKEDLLQGYIKNFPVCSIELKKVFTVKIEEAKQAILKDLKNQGKDLKTLNQISAFFEIKCRAVEGYFFYLNDFTSLQKVHQAKISAFQEFHQKIGDKDEDFWFQIKGFYYKLAKGSYQLQGYQELLHAFSMEKDLVEDEISKQYEENVYRLKALYQPLFDTKTVDQEVYLATVR